MKPNIHSFRTPVVSGATILFACFTLLHTGAQAADAFFIGSAGDHNLTTGSNWVGGSPAGDWDRLVFGSDVVDGTLNINNFNGRSGITLTPDLTQDITIENNQPLIMGAVTSDGFIDMSAATHNLTINTPYWNWSPIEWNVGSGATLFVNRGIYENASWSLTKNGAGNAWITAAGNRTGTTIINGGALVALRSTLGTGAVEINNGGTLYVNDQWVLCGVNGFGVAEQNVASVTVNAGGQLALDPGNGYANGATNLYLNGGSVTGGNNAQPFGGLYLYNGNEQITAGGGTTSTISADMAFTGNNNTITVEGGSSLNITNVLKDNGAWGAGGIIKAGAGTLTLSDANTYTGTTTISGGTLEIGGAGTLGGGNYAGDISNGGALLYSSSANQTLSGFITGSGSITMSGSGTLTLTQTFNDFPTHYFNGAITINSGTLIAPNEYWTLNPTSITVNGGLLNMQTRPSELGYLALNGGTVTSNGVENTSFGNIILYTDTTVPVGGAAVSTISVNQVKLRGTNSFDVGAGSALNLTSEVGEYGGAGSLNKTGAGTMTLTGANTYSGGTTISAGTLKVTNGGALGSGNAAIGGAGALTFDTNGGSYLLNGTTITGTGTMNVTGGNTLVFGGGGPVNVNLSAGAQINLQSGYLESSSSFQGLWTNNQASLDVASGAVFGLKENQVVVDALTGSGTVRQDHPLIDGNTSSLVVGIANGSGTFSGVIQDNVAAASLFKTGTGTQTLSGTNTYTGTTTISAGILALGAGNVLPDGTNVTLGMATLDAATFTDTVGTLDVSGAGAINLGAGAALAFADSHSVSWSGTLTLTGTYVSGSSLRFGTDATGLTPGQLAAISKPGGGAVALNASGYLIDAPAGYASWKAINAPGVGPGTTPGEDYDGDCVSNGAEFVLGGSKDTNDLSLLPTISQSGANMVFSFQRSQTSIDGTTTVAIEVGTDLISWPDSYNVPGPAQVNNPGVTVSKDTSAGFDTITLTVPRAPNITKFARLVVTPAP
jgi:autotransporter-associated beta strand protein